MTRDKIRITLALLLITATMLGGCGNAATTDEAQTAGTDTTATDSTVESDTTTAETAVSTDISTDPIERTEYVLGTISTIKIFDHASDALLQTMFDRLTEIENHMSTKIETSDVYLVNQSAGVAPVKVSEDTFFVIKTALEYAQKSDGIFDISLGPVIDLWGIGTDAERLPADSEIQEALKRVDYKKVTIDEANQTVFLQEAGMKIDLGGIAKGYAADEIKRIAQENDVVKAMINLGGNVYAYGEKEAGTPWKVGIQSPFYERNDYFGIVSVADKTVVTSGPYERYFEQDGRIYHHIFNHETGYPTDNEVAAVTIVADSSIAADAMSTILFCLGVEEGLKFVETMDNVECVYVTQESKVYVSEKLKTNLTIVDDAFTLVE